MSPAALHGRPAPSPPPSFMDVLLPLSPHLPSLKPALPPAALLHARLPPLAACIQIKDVASSGRTVTTAHAGLKGLLGVDERPLAVTSGPLLAVTWSKHLGGE